MGTQTFFCFIFTFTMRYLLLHDGEPAADRALAWVAQLLSAGDSVRVLFVVTSKMSDVDERRAAVQLAAKVLESVAIQRGLCTEENVGTVVQVRAC